MAVRAQEKYFLSILGTGSLANGFIPEWRATKLRQWQVPRNYILRLYF